MKHRLLILGTLGEFVQLVQKSREKGYYTIVCDGYSDGLARKFADEAYQIPVELQNFAGKKKLTVSLLPFLTCFWNAW